MPRRPPTKTQGIVVGKFLVIERPGPLPWAVARGRKIVAAFKYYTPAEQWAKERSRGG